MSEHTAGRSDTELRHELHEWTHDVTQNLCAALTPPVTRLCERIHWSINATDAGGVNDVFAELTTEHHPIQILPHMPALPPEMPLPFPRNHKEVENYIGQSLIGITRHNASIAGYTDQSESTQVIADCLIIELRNLIASGKRYYWSEYDKAHTAQHARDFCSLSSEAIRAAVTEREPNDFNRLQEELITKYLPRQHDTYLTQNTSSLLRQAAHIRVATGTNEDFTLRLVRAAALIVDWMEQDSVFQIELEQQATSYDDTVRNHTVRAHGRQFPNDRQALLHTCQEAIAVALVTQIRLLVDGHEDDSCRILPYLTERRLVTRSTAITPIGLVGPAQFQNRSFENHMITFPRDSQEPRLDKDVRHTLGTMSSRWLREIDHPAWQTYHEQLMAGRTDAQPPVRTGVVCPATLRYTDPETGTMYPDAISSLTRALFAAADCIQPSFGPLHTKYRPWEVPQFVDRKSGLLTQEWLDRAGKSRIREWLGGAATRRVAA